MRIQRTIAGLTLALSLTALVGCGSSGSSKSSDTKGSSGLDTTTAGNGSTGGAKGTFTDVCTKITTDDVGAIVGATVTMQKVPGSGCNFTQDDPRAAGVTFNSSSSSTANGGYESAKSGLTSVIDGEAKDLDGVGEKAFMEAGPALGGSSIQGSGLVQVGPTLVQVTVIQSSEMSQEDVEALTKKLVELAAAKA